MAESTIRLEVKCYVHVFCECFMKRKSKKSQSFDVIEDSVDELKHDISSNLDTITEKMIHIDFQVNDITSRINHITQSVEEITPANEVPDV